MFIPALPLGIQPCKTNKMNGNHNIVHTIGYGDPNQSTLILAIHTQESSYMLETYPPKHELFPSNFHILIIRLIWTWLCFGQWVVAQFGQWCIGPVYFATKGMYGQHADVTEPVLFWSVNL